MWLLLALAGFSTFIVSIVALLLSVIKKNKDLRKQSLICGLLAMIMFVIGALNSPTDESESSVETAKTEQTSKKQSKKTSATSSSKKKTSSSSKSSSSKTVSSSKSSSSSTEASSSSSTETRKTYDDAANTAFASELNFAINDVLKQSGITDSFAVMPNGSSLIDVVVPQDYKYLPNSQIQQLADTLLHAKENVFQEWNAKPENNYNETYGPRLYVKSPDGTTLAKESFWGGKMKRVIDNK